MVHICLFPANPNANLTCRYTELRGTLALRREIVSYLRTRKGVEYDANTEVLVSNGAKQSLSQLVLSVVAPGDKVLIPAPFWLSYAAQVAIAGGEVVMLHTRIEDSHLLTPEDLEAALSNHPTARLLMLCNPSNPTGSVYNKAHLAQLAAVLDRHPHVLVLSDEIYERIIYDEEHVCFASVGGMRERTVVINGVSKSHGMTGFRVGYMAGPAPVIAACTRLQSQLTTSAGSVSQYAAEVAYRETDSRFFEDALAGFRERRGIVMKHMNELRGVGILCAEPKGAFYVFPQISSVFGKRSPSGRKIENSNDFVEYVLEEYLVALVAGDAFAAPSCVRISFASSDTARLELAMQRIKDAVVALA
eukprot:c10618_g1_i2.p1 GENE.c10618_g1_i2~~c10618_g1_i2.p1  ORF type:complete len:361 (-),score=93.73 c10618_g1_i2:108-1190(-)